MASTTYFGRPKTGGASLGADFDLLAKWTRAFSMGHPIHSYYLTQLSSDDRAQLFTGPAQEFRLEEGPDNTVKLETLQDEVDRIDPDVVAMIQSANYQRSEARQLELRNEIEDAQEEAEGAAALALSHALLRGMDGPPAEQLAKRVSDRILDSAGAKVRRRWKAARSERLMSAATSETCSSPEPDAGAPIGSVPEYLSPWWNCGTHPTQPAKVVAGDAQSTSATQNVRSATTDTVVAEKARQPSPQQKPTAPDLMSPRSSVPEYGSETSSDSAQWNSPRAEMPSSPDLESVIDLEDSGGVSLLPTSLAKELGFQDESDAAPPTPTCAPARIPAPAPAPNHPQPQTSGGHLGAGLGQAFFVNPAATVGARTIDTDHPAKRAAVLASFRAAHKQLVDKFTKAKPSVSDKVEAPVSLPLPAHRSAYHPGPQPASHAAPQQAPLQVPIPFSHQIPVTVPVAVFHPVPLAFSHQIPVLLSRPVPQSVPQPVPQPIPQPIPQPVSHSGPSPFSPSSKTTGYPVAIAQPWTGFTCYEISARVGNDQLVPKYWTTKRGKERYIRHKIGQLKLDDAKLRSDRVSGAVARNPIHVFIDLSNIIIGFYDSMKESRGLPVNKRVMAPPFSFKNFDTILTRDRNVAKRIVAGSMTNSYTKRRPGYMSQAEELNYEMNILERVPKPASPVRKRKAKKAGNRDSETLTSGADTSGEEFFVGPMKQGEQGVDELLHLKILQSALDTAEPATIVLATGDAATAQYSDGFKKNIERALSHGWNIELYGWSRNISSAWRDPEFAEKWGYRFKIVELDGFCEELFDMTVESLEQQ